MSETPVLKALRHLANEGVLVKARVPRPEGGAQQLWVPQAHARSHPPAPTLDEMAAEIMARGLSGEWAALPSQTVLARHFGVGRRKVVAVTDRLAKQRMAVKVRMKGQLRWRIIRPHEVRGVNPASTVPARRVLVGQLIRRIQDREFRYRLPDGSVHDRPFLVNSEIRQQYGTSTETITKVKKDLVHLGWIVPGKRPTAPFLLAEHVLPVDRAAHPQPRLSRQRPGPKPNRRAREIAEELIKRILADEFTTGPFPWLVDVMAEYNAADTTVRSAFDEMQRGGWVKFRYKGPNRIVELADQLPEQPDTRLTIPVTDLGLTSRTLNCLLREGVATVGDLISYTDQELLGIIGEIKRTLTTLGFAAGRPLATRWPRTRLGR